MARKPIEIHPCSRMLKPLLPKPRRLTPEEKSKILQVTRVDEPKGRRVKGIDALLPHQRKFF